jgi:hypothetical protein
MFILFIHYFRCYHANTTTGTIRFTVIAAKCIAYNHARLDIYRCYLLNILGKPKCNPEAGRLHG